MMRLLLAVALLAVACGGTEAEAAAASAPVDASPFVGTWHGRVDGTMRGPNVTGLTKITVGADGALTIGGFCSVRLGLDSPPGPGPKADIASPTAFDVRPFDCPPWEVPACSSSVLNEFGLYISFSTTVTGGHGSVSPAGEITLTLTGTRNACDPNPLPAFVGPFTMTFVGTR